MDEPRRFALALALAAWAAACSGSDEDAAADGDADADLDREDDATGDDGQDVGPSRVTVEGVVEKGPFVRGSSVRVSAVDGAANPTTDLVEGSTTDDLGTFSVQLEHQGPVLLEATGTYFNEVTALLSTRTMALRSYCQLSGSEVQRCCLNLITQLAHERVRTRMREGETLEAAVAASEGELRRGLGVGPAGFDPEASGSSLSMLEGDTDAAAYLFAVSAVIAQAAATEAGPEGDVDASLQALVDGIASDLGPDGALDYSRRALLREAQAAVDVGAVTGNLTARLAEIGSEAVVPDLDRVLDSDLDSVANREDNCPHAANTDQADSDGDGRGDACSCGNRVVNASEGEECDDGNTASGDGCQANCLWPACGDGVYDYGIPDAAGNARSEFCLGADPDLTLEVGGVVSWVGVADVTGDGEPDVVALERDGGNLVVFPGDGAGGLGEAARHAAGPDTRWCELTDVDADSDLDAVVARSDGVALLANDGGGLFAAPVLLEGLVPARRIAVADLDGDEALDLVATGDPDGGGLVGVFLGDGTGAFGAALTTAVPCDQPENVVLADFTGDGLIDAVIHDSAGLVSGGLGTGDIVLLAGDGAGGLAVADTLAQLATTFLLVADVEGDGAAEILTVGADRWLVLSGAGGTFAELGSYGFGSVLARDPRPFHAVLRDENGDGEGEVLWVDYDSRLGIDPTLYFQSLDGTNHGYQVKGQGVFRFEDLSGDAAPDLVMQGIDAETEVVVQLQRP
jgi:cysteine-rich repeat protein